MALGLGLEARGSEETSPARTEAGSLHALNYRSPGESSRVADSRHATNRATRIQTTQVSHCMALPCHITDVPCDRGTEKSGRAKAGPGVGTGSCRAGRGSLPCCIMGNEGLPYIFSDVARAR